MTNKALQLNIDKSIAHIQLSRPDAMNSLNADFWREFPAMVQRIDKDALARVMVLSSTGKHFSAGIDLNVFSQWLLPPDQSNSGRRHEAMMRNIEALQQVFTMVENARLPVVAAIQGGCIGGALDLVSACDIRYCTKDAFFTIEETKLGITADLGTLQRLPHLMPMGLVKELAYTGRRLEADEAMAVGFVNGVYDDQATLLTAVNELAADIASRSPLAVSGCKEMLNYTRDHSVQDGLKAMVMWQSGMFQPHEDLLEAFNAKTEQRAPQFSDLTPNHGLFGKPAAS